MVNSKKSCFTYTAGILLTNKKEEYTIADDHTHEGEKPINNRNFNSRERPHNWLGRPCPTMKLKRRSNKIK